MTIPVTSLTNLFGNTATNTVAGTSSEASRSFTKVMDRVTSGNNKNDTTPQDKKTFETDPGKKMNPTQNEKISDGKVMKKDQNKSTALDKKADISQENELNEEAFQTVNEKAEQLIASIAEKMDVSEEDVLQAMEALGMTSVDLLNPEMLSQLVVTISGEDDMLSLVMDEELYGNLNELLQTADAIKTELTEMLGISKEELPNVLEQVSNLMKDDIQTSDIQGINEKTDTNDNQIEQTDFNTSVEAETSEKNKDVIVEVSGKVPTQSETQTEKTSVNANVEETPETEETIEKPLESTTQQPGAQSKNTQEGYQESGHSFLQSLTETAAALNEQANVNAADASFTNALNAQDTESIMKQMVDYMKLHVSANVSEMEIQLQPASLGTVNLNIASKNGVITAQFTAQSETVKEALESQIVQLRENLDERGIKVEAIEVTVSSHEFERNLEQGEQEARDSEQTEAAKKTGRRRIVLNQGESEDSEEMDIDGLDEADRIQVELMQQRGNTMSLMA